MKKKIELFNLLILISVLFCFIWTVFKINLNWKLITLQYCGGFSHTSKWISHGGTCVPPSKTLLPPASLPHPSGLLQSTSFECPASCIKLALVIYFTYGNIHVSMLVSHIVSPSPFPTESKSLYFTSVSFLLSFMSGHCYHFLNSIYMR